MSSRPRRHCHAIAQALHRRLRARRPIGDRLGQFFREIGGEAPWRQLTLAERKIACERLVQQGREHAVELVERPLFGGHVVRSIAGEKNDIRMVWASGFDVLPDGNMMISDYQGHRVMEVGKDGKILHEVRMPTRSTASIAMVP